MRSLALVLAAALPLTAAAQAPLSGPNSEAQGPSSEEGFDLLQRGVGILAENFWRRVQPQVEDAARGLDEALSSLGPALHDLAALIDDIGNYQRPERLANGDILIRRKPDAPPPPLDEGRRGPAGPQPESPAPPPEPRQPAPLPSPPVDL